MPMPLSFTENSHIEPFWETEMTISGLASPRYFSPFSIRFWKSWVSRMLLPKTRGRAP